MAIPSCAINKLINLAEVVTRGAQHTADDGFRSGIASEHMMSQLYSILLEWTYSKANPTTQITEELMP